MPDTVMRAVIDALLPDGAAWTPETGGDLDLLLDWMADNEEVARLALGSLARLRDPQLTPLLGDLENEYGIIPAGSSTEAERRDYLGAFMQRSRGNGAYDFLQDKLQAAGFDVYVHRNDPAVDPANFYDLMDVIAGELIVNQVTTSVDFTIPADSGYWPLIFFVGGPATRDSNGRITAIEYAGISSARRNDLKKIILTYKPMHSWCVFIDTYTDYLDGTKYLDGSDYLDGFGTEVR